MKQLNIPTRHHQHVSLYELGRVQQALNGRKRLPAGMREKLAKELGRTPKSISHMVGRVVAGDKLGKVVTAPETITTAEVVVLCVLAVIAGLLLSSFLQIGGV